MVTLPNTAHADHQHSHSTDENSNETSGVSDIRGDGAARTPKVGEASRSPIPEMSQRWARRRGVLRLRTGSCGDRRQLGENFRSLWVRSNTRTRRTHCLFNSKDVNNRLILVIEVHILCIGFTLHVTIQRRYNGNPPEADDSVLLVGNPSHSIKLLLGTG